MSDDKPRVVIIGGGTTGLTATYYLQKYARDNHLPIDVKLIEASHRLGGKIQPDLRDGFVIERGPDSFLARKKSATRLAKEVGMEDLLIRNSTGKSFVLVHEQLYSMPGGSIMGIPTEIAPFVTTGLFSPIGKIRAAGDFLLSRSPKGQDQSLGVFLAGSSYNGLGVPDCIDQEEEAVNKVIAFLHTLNHDDHSWHPIEF